MVNQAMDPPAGLVPLVDGCAAAKADYWRVRALVCRGDIAGARIRGRWFVDIRDVARWKREQDEPAPAA